MSDVNSIRRMAARLADSGKPAAALALLRPLAARGAREDVAALGRAALDAGLPQEALDAYQQLIKRHPEMIEAWVNIGAAARALGATDLARHAWTEATRLAPSLPDPVFNLARLALADEHWHEAESLCRTVLALQPAHKGAALNLSKALRSLYQDEAAEACLRSALRHHPDDPDLSFALSLLLLSQRRFDEGWRRFDSRLALPDLFPHKRFAPDWSGDMEDLSGKRLLVIAEQGLGDMVMMSRYLPLLVRAAASVELLCPVPLAPLMARIDGLTVTPRRAPAISPDLQIGAFSLPRYLGIECEETPFRATQPDQDLWPARLGNTTPKIGLAWAGNPDHTNDKHRSLSTEAAARIIAAFPGHWVALHPTLPPPKGAQDVRLHLQDCRDSAALVSTLDIIVSVDTLWAHLAGSLGTPGLVLLPDTGRDWRWFEPSAGTSPWYPSLELMTMSEAEEIADHIADYLSRWINRHGFATTAKPLSS